MKVVILAGGYGSRLAEETRFIPKPMVEIGDKPILVHIMNIYAHYGFREFVIACGYKGDVIKEYFRSLSLGIGDWTVSLRNGEISIKDDHAVPDWNVTLVNTGLNTMTGGRLLRLQKYLGNEPFMVTYGDGVGDINIEALLSLHQSSGRLATLTAVRPPARFGSLIIEKDIITEFQEKGQGSEGWINGGFMVFEPAIFKKLKGENCVLERDVLENLAKKHLITAFRHEGFWHPMDTLRDKNFLDNLCDQGNAPWIY